MRFLQGFLLFVFCWHFVGVKGQSDRGCHVCGYTRNEGQVGYECVNQPESVSVPIACPEKDDQDRTQYCHTFTQQIKDYETNTMYIRSMLRTCQVVTVEEGCVDHANLRSCYSYCSDNLCNDQDESHKDGEEIPGGDGGDGGGSGQGEGSGDSGGSGQGEGSGDGGGDGGSSGQGEGSGDGGGDGGSSGQGEGSGDDDADGGGSGDSGDGGGNNDHQCHCHSYCNCHCHCP